MDFDGRINVFLLVSDCEVDEVLEEYFLSGLKEKNIYIVHNERPPLCTAVSR